MGNALKKIGNLTKALKSYETAARLNPLEAHMTCSYISIKMDMCSWHGLQDAINHLFQSGLDSKVKIHPFYLLSICYDPALLLKFTKLYILDNFSFKNGLGLIKHSKKLNRIRIAYFSADFRNHPVSHLTAELFEIHDRSRFEVFAFSLHRAPEDDSINARLRKGFDRFINVEDMSDLEIAKIARELEIDIAIDLCGQTEFAKTGIFSYRAAPIQVNWLGYPGTSGADFIDYIVADTTIIPESHQQFYTEKVVYLPDTYMVDDSMRIPSSRVFTREECGLPKNDFVFCCFNNSYKFNPQVLDSWSRILLRAENSVLWIPENNQHFKSNIVIEFEKRSIHSKRIIFAQRIELMADHLARSGLADLFLDTYPYNAHTTTMDSLKAGVPVLTLMGQSFTSRVAASLLNAIGLPELITTTQSEYEDKAIELAMNPQKLASLKKKLASNRLTAPLFNTPRFTKNLEAAYLKMYERYQAGSEPETLFIETSIL
jgi:predicted O-linked N-acetylglucosamine transferase (SPINDLY family)